MAKWWIVGIGLIGVLAFLIILPLMQLLPLRSQLQASIDLSVHEASLEEVADLIRTESGLAIEVSPHATGDVAPITMSLRGVRVRHVLEFVCLNTGFSMYGRGRTVVLVSSEGLHEPVDPGNLAVANLDWWELIPFYYWPGYAAPREQAF